jgi:hypothetical protein
VRVVDESALLFDCVTNLLIPLCVILPDDMQHSQDSVLVHILGWLIGAVKAASSHLISGDIVKLPEQLVEASVPPWPGNLSRHRRETCGYGNNLMWIVDRQPSP